MNLPPAASGDAGALGPSRPPAAGSGVGITRLERSADVLIVDDDEAFARMLAEFLAQEGFRTRTVGDGRAALERLRAQPPDLIVLDVMMPGLDGLATLTRAREGGDVPIIMVTARGQDHDRIQGLDLGADDYLAKPFNPHELAARIRAVLRRKGQLRQGVGVQRRLGPLALDPIAMTVTMDGVPARLTSAEFMVLSLLAATPGVVRSRALLTEQALGRPLEPFDRSIDTLVSNIRRKLCMSPDTGAEIRAVRGEGYLLTIAGAAG